MKTPLSEDEMIAALRVDARNVRAWEAANSLEASLQPAEPVKNEYQPTVEQTLAETIVVIPWFTAFRANLIPANPTYLSRPMSRSLLMLGLRVMFRYRGLRSCPFIRWKPIMIGSTKYYTLGPVAIFVRSH